MSAALTSADTQATRTPTGGHDAEVAAVFDEAVLLDAPAEAVLAALLEDEAEESADEAEESADEAEEDPESPPAEPAEPLLADPLPAVAPWSLR
ncbi:hypothetical protein [Brevibacterium sp. UBA7493]|uniref:hypothetical protein n=1 Tax=Brevibacterium sp. UBA7493 TaxID=1946121 RepID=UPI0032E48744